MEQLLEILAGADEVEKGAVVFHLYQKIDVAVRPGIASRDRPEHAEVPGAVSRGDPEDLVPVIFEDP